MHILYLDDSGSSSSRSESYFTLGGVCIPEHSLRWLSHQIESIAEELAPSCPETIEFHAAEIFRGKEPCWATFTTKEARRDLIKRVLTVLDTAYPDIIAFACAVHKPSFPQDDPVQLAFEDISSRFDMYLKRSNSIKGIIVLDKSSYENSLQRLATAIRRQGNRWGSYLTNVCEVPLFVDSKASRNIQLADHIAYAVFRRYEASDLTYFNCIEDRFDHDPNSGEIYGLVHKHLNRRACTCPACITRRQNSGGRASVNRTSPGE